MTSLERNSIYHRTRFELIDQNVFAWTEEQRSRIKPLLSSLNEALHALETDHGFLTTGGVFTKEMLDQ